MGMMKKDIHPNYYKNAKVTCSCGATFEVASTQKEIEVDTCSQCHPVYTGKKKAIDAQGQVKKFEERLKKAKKE